MAISDPRLTSIAGLSDQPDETEAMTLGSPLLSAIPGLRHAFFSREGGVSEGIYAGLNGGPRLARRSGQGRREPAADGARNSACRPTI